VAKRELLLFFALGAGTIALWVDVRFPKLVPECSKRRLAHAIVALGAVQFLAPGLMKLLFSLDESAPFVLLGLFAIFLPALIYSFLSGIWLLRLFRGALLR
jgi:hypothetical protein